MRKLYFFSSLLILTTLTTAGLFTFMSKERKTTEHFIETYFLNDNGIIATYILEEQGYANEEWAAQGQETLSESTGLYLSYLLLTKNEPKFKAHVDILQNFFLNEDGFIYWKVGPHGEKISTSNALIDDLRIMKTLYAASETFSDPTYRELAKRIQDFILNKQLNQGYMVSFYEQEFQQPASEIPLSYLDVEALNSFPRHIAKRQEELLLKHQGSTFYPERFQITTGNFEWNEEVHLIDQILIAHQLHLLNGNIKPFLDFIQESFHRDGKIFGKYHRISQNPTVDYESAAVYGLLIILFLDIDQDFSWELYNRLAQLKNENGGYMAGENAHFFDNILPLLAETQLHQ